MTDLVLQKVSAAAVGEGIRLAIAHAQQKGAPASAEEWVDFCVGAADEAYASAMENPPPVARGPVAQLLHELEEDSEEEDVESERALARRQPSAISAASAAAKMAFRCCMPKLTGRRMTQAYIACVAAGVQHGHFTGSEATSLLYTAQLALAAYPNRRAQRGRK